MLHNPLNLGAEGEKPLVDPLKLLVSGISNSIFGTEKSETLITGLLKQNGGDRASTFMAFMEAESKARAAASGDNNEVNYPP